MARVLMFALLFLGTGVASAQPPGNRGPNDGCVPADVPVSEGFLTSADGTRLYYRRVGRGRPETIYLHGGPGGTIYNGGCEIAELGRERTLVLYDQRGGGRSELVIDPARLTWRHHVEDLEAVRRHFGIRRAALIGLSWGSTIAVLYAQAHPDRVSRLMLLGPMPIAKSPFDQQRDAAIIAAAGEPLMQRRRELQRQIQAASTDAEVVAACRRLLNEAALPYVLDPARRRTLTGCDYPAEVIKNRALVNRQTIQSLGEWDFRPAAAAIDVPILVVEGSRSVIPLPITEAWTQTAPNARLLLIPDAGHEVGMDQPEALLRAARTFLRGGWPAGAVR